MYFDEDGDLAHEFYEEVLPRYKDVRVAAIGQLLNHPTFRRKGGKRKMRRIEKNLRCLTMSSMFLSEQSFENAEQVQYGNIESHSGHRGR